MKDIQDWFHEVRLRVLSTGLAAWSSGSLYLGRRPVGAKDTHCILSRKTAAANYLCCIACPSTRRPHLRRKTGIGEILLQ